MIGFGRAKVIIRIRPSRNMKIEETASATYSQLRQLAYNSRKGAIGHDIRMESTEKGNHIGGYDVIETSVEELMCISRGEYPSPRLCLSLISLDCREEFNTGVSSLIGM